MKTICTLIVLAAIATNVLGNYEAPLTITADISKYKEECDFLVPLHKVKYWSEDNIKKINQDMCESIVLINMRSWIIAKIYDADYDKATDTYKKKEGEGRKKHWDKRVESEVSKCKEKCTDLLSIEGTPDQKNQKWTACQDFLIKKTRTLGTKYPRCPGSKHEINLVDLYEVPLSFSADITKHKAICDKMTPYYETNTDGRNDITEDVCSSISMVMARAFCLKGKMDCTYDKAADTYNKKNLNT